jgi:lipoprotein-releasing system ATP-binding protein
LDNPERTPALRLENLDRGFTQGDRRIDVLQKACATFYPGETVALLGPSGAGKSTLLHIAGLLERPDEGAVIINGIDCGSLSEPQLILGQDKPDAEARAKNLLKTLGLEQRWEHRPAELSGGEQQRVAIARAVANQPKVLLADEPTGNLDPHTAERVFAELMKLVTEEGVAAVVATHNLELAARMDRTLLLTDGHLIEEDVVVVETAS